MWPAPASTGKKAFAFAQKYDSQGAQQYSTRIGGDAITSADSIAVNAAGEALINGEVSGAGFPATPGAPNAGPAQNSADTGFVVKLDADGNVILAARGVGVGAAAYGPDDTIYVAGISSALPATTGAFQPDHALQGCGGGLVGIPCLYHHVAKLSADGMRVLYSTFVTGSFGAVPVALAVDDTGAAIVSGTTGSPDYPTTARALLPTYIVSGTLRPGPVVIPFSSPPPASSGYVTKLNPDGSGLLWSTYFSGTGAESLTDMKILSGGRIAIAGQTFSRDLPGIGNVPRGCAPVVGRALPFVSILSGNGATLLSTIVPWEIVARGGPLVVEGSRGSLGVISSRQYVRYNSDATPRAACLADPADWTLLGTSRSRTIGHNLRQRARFSRGPFQRVGCSHSVFLFGSNQYPGSAGPRTEYRLHGSDRLRVSDYRTARRGRPACAQRVPPARRLSVSNLGSCAMEWVLLPPTSRWPSMRTAASIRAQQLRNPARLLFSSSTGLARKLRMLRLGMQARAASSRSSSIPST